MCGTKRCRGCKRDIWWWNEEVKEAMSRKIYVWMVMCRSSNESNRKKYIIMKNHEEYGFKSNE